MQENVGPEMPASKRRNYNHPYQAMDNKWYMQVLHMTDHNKPAWDVLHWATSTGDLAFEHTHQGLSEFEWLKANPAEEDKFSKAMKEVDSLGEAPSFSGQALNSSHVSPHEIGRQTRKNLILAQSGVSTKIRYSSILPYLSR